MSKQVWKPGNMLYPVPAALISCRDKEGRSNLLTVAWCGTVCSDPPMVSVSIRKERFSHDMILETGEFVLNLTTESMVKAVDFCGVRSGKNMDKWEASGLHEEAASRVSAPLVKESPVSIECRVTEVKELGSHDLFLAEVVSVDVDEHCLDERGSLDLKKCGLTVYSHGEYMALGRSLGTFGFSVKKETRKKPAAGKKIPKTAENKAPETAEKKAPEKAEKRAPKTAGKKIPKMTGRDPVKQKTGEKRKNR